MQYYTDFAELYDYLSPGIKGDVEFYLKQAKKAKGPVLEAGCGTGRILLPILKAGVDIEGIDNSKEMLSLLRKKARKMGLEPRVRKADMTDFNPRKKYDLIIVPYRAFLHVESNQDRIKALKNFKKHLRKGGKLVLDFFFPNFNFMAEKDGKVEPGPTFAVGERIYDISSKICYHPVEQFTQVFWYLKDRQGREKKVLKIRFTYIYKREFGLLLRMAGFRKWKVYGGFKKEKLERQDQEMVWIVEN
jgi:SAM-dependent methyltransferase